MPTTIADPAEARIGLEPKLLGIDHIVPDTGHVPHQRYRTEAWQLNNGDRVVIVSANGGTSLMNASEEIAAAVDLRWGEKTTGPAVTIIEDWATPGGYAGIARFRVSNREGGSSTFNHDEWDAAGLVLPRDS